MLDGAWIPEAAELSGQTLPAGSLSHLTLLLTRESYTLKAGGTAIDRGYIELLPATTPAAMRIVGGDGPNQGRTIPAIYQLDADRLTICYDLSGARLPVDFNTETDTQLYLIVYRRADQHEEH